jgi:hypothetical protein
VAALHRSVTSHAVRVDVPQPRRLGRILAGRRAVEQRAVVVVRNRRDDARCQLGVAATRRAGLAAEQHRHRRVVRRAPIVDGAARARVVADELPVLVADDLGVGQHRPGQRCEEEEGERAHDQAA